MDIRRQKALEFASDLAKQLITLSTGILAITITFSKDIVKATSIPRTTVLFLLVAWGVYLFSIICGIWTLMALTGELEPFVKPGDQNEAGIPEPTTKKFNVFLPTMLQILSFLLAIGFTIAFGIKSIY